jgi:hypothetical protein
MSQATTHTESELELSIVMPCLNEAETLTRPVTSVRCAMTGFQHVFRGSSKSKRTSG